MESARPRVVRRLERMSDSPYRLMHDEIHVWFASLCVSPETICELSLSLSHGERARAARFRDPRDRDHFIAAHGIMRAILGRYTGIKPHDLRFEKDHKGRPVLDRSSAGESLAFSMSHSAGTALYGLARECSVGVDIELINQALVDRDTLKRCLSFPERAAFDAMPPVARTDALFRFWTLKEAYLKAQGGGFAIPPSTIDVSAVTSRGPIVLTGRDEKEDHTPWTLVAIPALPGYAIAVAFRGSDRRILYRLYDAFIAEPATMNRPSQRPS